MLLGSHWHCALNTVVSKTLHVPLGPQSSPQLLQLVLVPMSMQPISQRSWPSGQSQSPHVPSLQGGSPSGHAQLPFVHVPCPSLHLSPQPPQFSGSVSVSTQPLSGHRSCPSGQSQPPSTHFTPGPPVHS